MKVLLLGAGASRGTFRFDRVPVPVSAEFGSALRTIEPNWFAKYPELPKVVAHLGLDPNHWSLESVWTCVDYHSKFFAKDDPSLSVFRDPPCWRQPGVDLKRALLDVYGKRCDDAAEQLPGETSYTLGALLRDLAPGDTVVSFNYDTVAERIARKFEHVLRAPSVSGEAHASAGVLFARPHGSASWRLKDQGRSVAATAGEGPVWDSLVPEQLAADEHPLLLGAVPIKSELIREVQTNEDSSGQSWRNIFVVIAAQWRALVDSIRLAEKIISVGYSFPPEDQYGRFLFQEALRPVRRKLVIEFYERVDRAPERAAEIMRTFGEHVASLHYRGPVEGPP
jgi:hypothetical protein